MNRDIDQEDRTIQALVAKHTVPGGTPEVTATPLATGDLKVLLIGGFPPSISYLLDADGYQR